MRERDPLLVLDDCEHLIGACAELARTLLVRCPTLRILATSREPLGIAGERVWPVPPISGEEAVQLFADRAAAVPEICRRLDAIPLAIELAAARVRVLTPAQIAEKLEDRFTLLTRIAHDTPATPHTPRRHRLELCASLSRRAGPAGPPFCVRRQLLVVRRRSRSPDRAGRQVARRDEESSDDGALPAPRHHPAVRGGAARERRGDGGVPATSRPGLPDDGPRERRRRKRRRPVETGGAGRGARQRPRGPLLEHSSPAGSRDRAATLAGAGTFATYTGDLSAALRWLEEAEEMWRAIGDQRELALTLSPLAQTLTVSDLDAAARRAEESVALARAHGTPWDLAYCLTNAAACVANNRGEYDQANRVLEEAPGLLTFDAWLARNESTLRAQL